MLNSFKLLVAPFLSFTFLMLGSGFLITFTSLKLHEMGTSSALIGVVNAAYYAGFLFGGTRVESLVSRIKHIRAYAVFASLLTMLVMFQGLRMSVDTWVVVRFSIGFCIAALYVVIESWMLVVTSPTIRGRVLGFYMLALAGGMALSQLLLLAIDHTTLEGFLISGLLIAFSVLPVTLTRTSAPELGATMPGALKKVFRSSPVGFFGAFLAGITISVIYSFLPLFANHYQYPPSYIMSLCIGGGFLAQVPVGWISDRISRRVVLVGLSLLGMIPAGLIFFFPEEHWLVYVAICSLGACSFTIYPTSISHACDRFIVDHLIAAAGILTLAYGAGAILGPLLCPFFLHALGYSGIFVFLITIFFLVIVLCIIGSFIRDPVPQEDKTHLVPISPQTAITYEMEPNISSEE